MGLFVKRHPKLNRQQTEFMKKQLNIDLSKYATKEEIDQYFNDKVTTEERKRIWNALSPNLKIKVLQYVKERREKNKNGK